MCFYTCVTCSRSTLHCRPSSRSRRRALPATRVRCALRQCLLACLLGVLCQECATPVLPAPGSDLRLAPPLLSACRQKAPGGLCHTEFRGCRGRGVTLPLATRLGPGLWRRKGDRGQGQLSSAGRAAGSGVSPCAAVFGLQHASFPSIRGACMRVATAGPALVCCELMRLQWHLIPRQLPLGTAASRISILLSILHSSLWQDG